MPIPLKEMFEKDLKGFCLCTVWSLELTHGIEGVHLSLLGTSMRNVNKERPVLFCRDKKVLKKAWDKIVSDEDGRRRARLVEHSFLCHVASMDGFRVSTDTNGMVRLDTLSSSVFDIDDLAWMIKQGGTPFEWASSDRIPSGIGWGTAAPNFM